MVLFTGDSTAKLFVNLPMAGVNATITDHFVMLFRDMADKTLYEFHNRNRFFHVLFIFMAVVMKGDKVTIIVINSGGGNDRTAKIASNVFYNCFGITFIRFGIHIKTFPVFLVAEGFDFFKRGSDSGLHFIEQGSAESVTKEGIVKIIDVTPESIVTVAAFRNETVDMGIPF